MGVEKQLLRAGTGPKPVPGQTVTVHCTGFGKNGDLSQKFWSTKDPGQEPFSFKIGQGAVIKDDGIEIHREGDEEPIAYLWSNKDEGGFNLSGGYFLFFYDSIFFSIFFTVFCKAY
ncbi:peptidyl-prolyl cis-trans isomerase FKBP12-like isoform X1 [Macadamia integrifolia]|uniref:peptidyl-prolyl cis-trans isomerase FKBP12-like isoform X1 n=1 Tax=Macadamia integrifolia TaxID=60698 RepID=UPI001C4FFB30|nr:peptidyl-prolyl cis-trans isomerase FKBP12-like isoform X1 [Macadamia integrifolia]